MIGTDLQTTTTGKRFRRVRCSLAPFSVVRAIFHTSYIWDSEISDTQFCNLSTAECILVPNFCVTFYVLDSRNVRSKFHIGIG